MTLNETEKRIIELTKRLVRMQVQKVPEAPFCCGFLWGYVTIRRAQKNGKIRQFNVRTLFGGSMDPSNWNEAIKLAEQVKDVGGLYVNMD